MSDPPPPDPSYPHASAGYGYVPPAQVERPGVVRWFYAYTVLWILVYLFALVAGVILAATPETLATDEHTPDALRFQGIAMAVISVPLIAFFVIALMLPRKPGTWVYHLVVICFGFLSCCFWPMSIPLLIYWLKSETKRWFGRNA